MKPAPLAETNLSNTACPRCGKALTDPSGLGWCQSCGFCKSLEEDKAKVVIPEAAARSQRLENAKEAVKTAVSVPRWFWLLLVGVIGFAAVSQLPARQLAANSFERALWTTVQIGAGLFLIFLAQFIAVVRIAPEDEKLGFKDALVPTRLWGLVIKRLPSLSFTLCLAAWGLSIVLSALIFIGGLGHWMTYLPGQKNAPGNAKKMTR
jgi:hypothetical protein